MTRVGDELWFCEHCTYAYNGVATGMSDAVATGRTRLDAIGRVAPDYEALETEGYVEFSERTCDCCGSDRGGSRHRHALCNDGGVKVGHQFRARDVGECFEPGHTYTVCNVYTGSDGAPRMDLTSELLDTTVAEVRIDDPALDHLGPTAEGSATIARMYARYERNPHD